MFTIDSISFELKSSSTLKNKYWQAVSKINMEREKNLKNQNNFQKTEKLLDHIIQYQGL